jgi:hypothetical protein
MADASAWLDEIAAGLSRIAQSVPEVEPILDSAAFTLRRVALETSIDSQDLGRRAGCCCGMDVGGLSLPALATSAVGLAAWGGPAAVGTVSTTPVAADAFPGSGDWMDRMDTPVVTEAAPATTGWASGMDTPAAGTDDWAAVGGAGGWQQDMAANNAVPSAIDTSGWVNEIHNRSGITVGGGLGTDASQRALFNQVFGQFQYPDTSIVTSGIDSVNPILVDRSRIQSAALGPNFGVPQLNVALGMAEF